MLRVSADARAGRPFRTVDGRPAHMSSTGEEIRMSSMKMGMAAAAACVAMLSMTVIMQRKRSTRKGRKR